MLLPITIFAQNIRDDAKLKIIVEDLKKGWLKYLHSLGTVEGSINYQRKRNNKIEYDYIMECVGMYPLWLDQRSPVLKHEKDNYTSVNVVGNNYQFSLRKADDDKIWTAREIKIEKADKKLTTWKFPVYLANPPSFQEDFVGYSIFNTFGVGLFIDGVGINLHYLLSSEYCTIKEINEIIQNGVKQLQLSFEFAMPDFPEGIKKSPDFIERTSGWKTYTLTGEITLITDYFLISEAKFHLEYMSFTRDESVKIIYDTKTYKTPLPKNYYVFSEYNDHSSGTILKNTSELTEKFDLRETNPKSLKRFTLSHYGLVEPDFGDSQRMSILNYIFMILGTFVMYIAVKQIIQRRCKKI
jgi:hypothetical protein